MVRVKVTGFGPEKHTLDGGDAAAAYALALKKANVEIARLKEERAALLDAADRAYTAECVEDARAILRRITALAEGGKDGAE